MMRLVRVVPVVGLGADTGLATRILSVIAVLDMEKGSLAQLCPVAALGTGAPL